MNVKVLTEWLQIIGNFGLLAGLILVALQLKQNADIAHAQMVSEGFSTVIEVQLKRTGEDPGESLERAIYDPDSLTDRDLVVLDALYTAHWMSITRTEFLYERGLSWSGPTTYAESTVYDYLDNHFGFAWWQNAKNGLGDGAPQTKSEIERLLGELGPGVVEGEKDELDRLRSLIQHAGQSGT